MLRAVDSVRVFTADLLRAREFFQDTLSLDMIFEDNRVVIFDMAPTLLIVEIANPDDMDESYLIGRFTGISFRVADAYRAHDWMRNRSVRIDGPPRLQPWGGTLFHFFDPDGNVLTAVEYPDRL